MGMSFYPLIIIGAGAAGLSASASATGKGIPHLVLEASHRIGGRGLTEMLEGKYAVDLGCHWLHSASMNPYVDWADKLGFGYQVSGDAYVRWQQHSGATASTAQKTAYGMHFNGDWLGASEQVQYEKFAAECDERIRQSARQKKDCAIWDVVDQDSRWSAYHAYWLSLMHSNDPDQVSIWDSVNYLETYEDWPLKEGYGALISEQGKSCPVSLNTVVQEIDWRSKVIRIKTSLGELRAQKVIISVSTGILGAGDIVFTPSLPPAKQEAIHALPLGNYNNLFFSIDPEPFDSDVPGNLHFYDGEHALSLRIKPFGLPYLFACTGGRFAWWLEKQGMAASEQFLRRCLRKIFGNQIDRHLREFRSSAWGYDPWVKGAYSSALPGHGHMRTVLADPLEEKLFFAGEATSTDALNTAHGAYQSGQRAVQEIDSD